MSITCVSSSENSHIFLRRPSKVANIMQTFVRMRSFVDELSSQSMVSSVCVSMSFEDHQEFFHQFSKSFQGTIIRKLPLEARRQVLRAADTAGIVDGPFHRRPGGDGISGHLFKAVFNCDF